MLPRSAFFLVTALAGISLIPVFLILREPHHPQGAVVEELETHGPGGHERALLVVKLADSDEEDSDDGINVVELPYNKSEDEHKDYLSNEPVTAKSKHDVVVLSNNTLTQEESTSKTANVSSDAKLLESLENLYQKVTYKPVIQSTASPVVSIMNKSANRSITVKQEYKQRARVRLHSRASDHTVMIDFPKVDRLYSDTPCNLMNMTRHWVQKAPENHSFELNQVEENLQKCLSAAELIDYFEKRNFTEVAVKNAHHFLLRMRDVVPSEFSATHGDTLCWKSQFRINLCEGKLVEGRIGTHMFSYAGNLLAPELQRILHYSKQNKYSSPITCLPSVFVAGFPKCGSSFVYCLIQKLYQFSRWKYLARQPEKEPHFWVPGGPLYHHHKPHNLGDLSRYIFNSTPRTMGNNTIAVPIDASPNTMFQWPRYSHKEKLENYCLVPSVLSIIQPNTKYIVVLRDPVTMLYSAFWFSTSVFCSSLSRSKQVYAPDDFHYKVEKKIKAFKTCRLFNPVDACLQIIYNPMKGKVDYGTGLCGRVRMEVGFYYHYIRRWLAVIPRKQFLFITTEELSSKMNNVVQELSDFLNLGLGEKHRFQDFRGKGNCKNVQSVFDYRHDPELRMRNDTRQLLYEFFEPFNQELAILLQDSKFHWKPPQ